MDKWNYIGSPDEKFFFRNIATNEIAIVECDEAQLNRFTSGKEACKQIIDHEKLINISIDSDRIASDSIVVLASCKDCRFEIITIDELLWLLENNHISSKQIAFRPPLNKLIPIFKHRNFEEAKNL